MPARPACPACAIDAKPPPAPCDAYLAALAEVALGLSLTALDAMCEEHRHRLIQFTLVGEALLPPPPAEGDA